MSSPRVDRGGVESGGDADATVDVAPAEAPVPLGPRTTAELAVPAGDHPELVAVERRHYLIGGEIAKGGMGRILEARDRRLGRPVAIKELLPKNRDASWRFEQEARITARLQHPGIIHVYEAGIWPGGEPFYAMPRVAGRSLDKVVAERPTLAERLGLVPNVIAAVDALAYAHSQRVIHRDLKPANILVGEFGETVVIDWGLAKDLATPPSDPSSLQAGRSLSLSLSASSSLNRSSGVETIEGAIVGTPAYMPPEQARGEAADERSDVYALGALLYHVLVGTPPYTGDSSRGVIKQVLARPPQRLRDREPGVPGDLVAIVEKAMARNPGQRYADAGELAQDLKRFQTGQLVAARRYSLGQRLQRWIARNRALLVLAAIAIAVLIAIATVSFQRIVAEKRTAEHRRDELLVEQGRSEILAGHAGRGLAYLAQAYRDGETDGPVRFLLREGMRSFRAQITAVDVGEPVYSLAYSPDGRFLAAGGYNGGIGLWTGDGRPDRQLDGHAARVTAVRFDPSGTHLVTASEDSTARIFDFGTGEVRILRGHRGPILDATISDDGRVVATAGADGTARIWEMTSGAEVATFQDESALLEDQGAIQSVRFSHDGGRLVTASSNTTASVWNVQTHARISLLRGHDDQVTIAIFAPDDPTLVVTGSTDGTARVWNADRGAMLLAKPIVHRGAVTALAMTRDGRRLITASADDTARIWELPEGLPREGRPVAAPALIAVLAGHDDDVLAVQLSPDESRIATTSFDGRARIWDAETGEPLALFEGHARMVLPLAFAPDGARLATGSLDRTLRIWDLTAAAAQRTLDLGGNATAIAVSRDGRTVATGAGDEILLWDASTGEQLRELVADTPPEPSVLAFSADGVRVLAGSGDADGAIYVWDTATGHLRARHPGGPAATFIGSRVASVRRGTTIEIWDPTTATGAPATSVDVGKDVVALAATPDGRRLVAASDKDVFVLDGAGGKPRAFAMGASNLAIALSHDGRWLATTGDGDYQQIWDLDDPDAKPVQLEGPTGSVMAVAFTPDGSRVVTAGARVISIWDRSNGKLLARRQGHEADVTALALGDDGATLWSAGDTTARAWDLDVARISPAELDRFIADHSPWMLSADDHAVPRPKTDP